MIIRRINTLSNSNLKDLLNEYDKKRLNNLHDAELRKKDLYEKYPRLQEIDDTLSKEAIRISKLIITSNNSTLLEELNTKIDTLKKEKQSILNSIGLDLNYLNPKYECEDCKDTGYITNNLHTRNVSLLKAKIIEFRI